MAETADPEPENEPAPQEAAIAGAPDAVPAEDDAPPVEPEAPVSPPDEAPVTEPAEPGEAAAPAGRDADALPVESTAAAEIPSFESDMLESDTGDADGLEAAAEDAGAWRGALAEALSEPPDEASQAPFERQGSADPEPEPISEPPVSLSTSEEPPVAEAAAPDVAPPSDSAPTSTDSDPALFTTAAEDLFRPPAIDDEPHLITLGRRLDPSLRVPRPVAPVIAPPHEPAAAPAPWWKTTPWADHIRTAARYAAYAAGGYLALVLVLILLFRFVNPPGSMLMLTQFLTGTAIDRTWVPLNSISSNLVRAVIVSEDGRFCEHSGIDTAAIKDAIERASRGSPRGASTISMQVIKNLFLWNAKSYVRKVIEIPLTLYMELVWPKSRILEVYLNIAEWGPGVFGAEAAARHHFDKAAARLSAREAALMASVLPNPVVRDAGSPGKRTSAKARVVQSRVKAYGAVASCVAAAAAAPPAAVPARKPRPVRKTPPRPAPRKKQPADDWAPTLNFGPT